MISLVNRDNIYTCLHIQDELKGHIDKLEQGTM